MDECGDYKQQGRGYDPRPCCVHRLTVRPKPYAPAFPPAPALPTPARAGADFDEGTKTSFFLPPSPSTRTVMVSLPLKRPRRRSSRERVFELVLDRATQRTGTVLGVEALVDEELLGFVGQHQFEAASPSRLRTFASSMSMIVLQVLAVQAAEDDDVVQAVEELGPEVLLHLPLKSSFIFS